MAKRKHIHVFTSTVLPINDIFATGGGLRSLQIIEGLKLHGFDVTYSMPIFTDHGQKYYDRFSNDDIRNQWNFDNQERLLNRFKPDVAIWNHVNTLAIEGHDSIGIVVDLHGPINIEENFSNPDGMTLSTQKVINNLGKIDFCTTVSERQKYYWLAYMVAAGIDFYQLHKTIGWVPVSIPINDEFEREIPKTTKFISAGGFYPWQSTFEYLKSTAEALVEAKTGELHLFGSPHRAFHKHYDTAIQQIEELKSIQSVVYHGYVSRNEILREYESATCALDMYAPNVERMLAVTTRTMEYLACKLPVIYADYAILSNYIYKYDAGWIVPHNKIKQLKETIHQIVSSSTSEIKIKSENSATLIREEFELKKSLTELAHYCDNPQKRSPQKKITWALQTGEIRQNNLFLMVKTICRPVIKVARKVLHFQKKLSNSL